MDFSKKGRSISINLNGNGPEKYVYHPLKQNYFAKRLRVKGKHTLKKDSDELKTSSFFKVGYKD